MCHLKEGLSQEQANSLWKQYAADGWDVTITCDRDDDEPTPEEKARLSAEVALNNIRRLREGLEKFRTTQDTEPLPSNVVPLRRPVRTAEEKGAQDIFRQAEERNRANRERMERDRKKANKKTLHDYQIYPKK